MWVWTVTNPTATVALARSMGVGTIFLAVPAQLPTAAGFSVIRDLARQLHVAGIQVHALGGDPTWIDNQPWVVDNWLLPAMSTDLFNGIHVDIEPYSTPAWTSDQAGVVGRYLATLDALRAAAGRYLIEADVPFWLHTVTVGPGSTLDREILMRTAGITIMAYRNTAAGTDGTNDLAGPQASVAQSMGKRVGIGQETTYLGSTPDKTKQTFYGQTKTQMAAQLVQVDAAFSGNRYYAGIAVHDDVGYAALPG